MVSDQSERDLREPDSRLNQHDSVISWLVRGLVLGVLLMGSANAMSFFVRSRGWGTLLGDRETSDEAIGFPLLVWEEVSGYGSHTLRIGAFVFNIAVAIAIGICMGVIAVWQRSTLNQIMDRFRSQATGVHVRLQFSLRGLLITTVLAALAAAAARSFTPRVEVLGAIYALGPAALIVLAFLPRRLRWQQRVAILIPATVMLIAFAIALGTVLGVEFDKVMLGIFICWTPQAAIGAIVLTSYLLLREYQAINA